MRGRRQRVPLLHRKEGTARLQRSGQPVSGAGPGMGCGAERRADTAEGVRIQQPQSLVALSAGPQLYGGHRLPHREQYRLSLLHEPEGAAEVQRSGGGRAADRAGVAPYAQWVPDAGQGDCGSYRRVWWQCANGHVWKALIYSRAGVQKCGCPVCAGKGRPSRKARYDRILKETQKRAQHRQSPCVCPALPIPTVKQLPLCGEIGTYSLIKVQRLRVRNRFYIKHF